MKKKPTRACRKQKPLVLRLYEAAKSLSDSCGDNYGSEAADNGEYETYFSDKAKTALDNVLAEFETQNNALCVKTNR